MQMTVVKGPMICLWAAVGETQLQHQSEISNWVMDLESQDASTKSMILKYGWLTLASANQEGQWLVAPISSFKDPRGGDDFRASGNKWRRRNDFKAKVHESNVRKFDFKNVNLSLRCFLEMWESCNELHVSTRQTHSNKLYLFAQWTFDDIVSTSVDQQTFSGGCTGTTDHPFNLLTAPNIN